MKSVEKAERNHCIDLLRGLCLLGVLWHHTCLYGGDFIPKFMQQLSFFLEAPALFFVSGLTYQYIKREMFINNIVKLALSFTLVAVLINGAMHELSLRRIIYPLFLNGLELPGKFSVLQGSYWFVTCYVVVLLASMVVLKTWHKIYPWIMAVIFVTLVAVYLEYISFRNFYIGVEPFQRFIFYWFFFLLGYWSGERIMQTPMQKKVALIIVLAALVLLCGAYLYEDSSVTNIYYQKHISGFPYLLVALPVVAGFIWFYNPNRQNKLLEHIGKNSLFYFIGQGLACAFVVLIEPYIQRHWGIKLPLMFIINVILMVICSEIFKVIYNVVVVKCLRLRG